MKTYEFVIKPQTPFGTPLKGITLFGQICWELKNEGIELNDLLSEYPKNPFMIVSSGFIKLNEPLILKKPSLPLKYFIENLDRREIILQRKKLKGKKWIKISKQTPITSIKNLEYFDELPPYKLERLNRNKINRLTNTTGLEGFSPFFTTQLFYHPDLCLSIFVAFDGNKISYDVLFKAIQNIGLYGFGRDTSVGLGKFSIIEAQETNLYNYGSNSPNAIYTLAPCVPEKDFYKNIFFEPFIHFGKHGDHLAKSNNPFKNPIIMADEAAVLIPKEELLPKILQRGFIGQSIHNLSKVEPNTIAQGYSLFIPIKIEEAN